MSEPYPLSESDEADLAALADGRLDPARRAEVEARVEAEPELAAALARQRRGLIAIAAAAEDVSAPLALRVRIEAMQKEAAAPRRRGFRLPSLGRWLPAAGLAAAAAVAVLVVLVAGGGPSVDSMVAAALRPPVAAVSVDPNQERLLRQQVEGVRFPNYAGKFGWEAAGMRTDELDGRLTRTVFYRRDGRDVAYTIVAGDALPWPDDAARAEREGIELRSFTQDGRTVVTWLRQGHTCVLSGEGVDARTLIELAAWKGQGAVSF
jgi:hypothetical protein